MDLGDQRAGRVDHRQSALGSGFLDGLRDTVRAEDRDAAWRHLIQLVDEIGAFGAQAFDDMAVMDDFMPDIDRRAVFIDRTFDDFDRTFDTGTEAAGLSEDYLHGPILFSGRIGRLVPENLPIPQCKRHTARPNPIRAMVAKIL